MHELEASLQQFGEFLLKGQLIRQSTFRYFLRWVRRFPSRQASDVGPISVDAFGRRAQMTQAAS